MRVNWHKPAIGTQIVKAQPKLSSKRYAINNAKIKNRFNKRGAAAVTLYRLRVFKIPPRKAEIDIRNIYGNMTRPNLIDRSNRGSDEKPLAVLRTKNGINISAIAVNKSKVAIKIDKASDKDHLLRQESSLQFTAF